MRNNNKTIYAIKLELAFLYKCIVNRKINILGTWNEILWCTALILRIRFKLMEITPFYFPKFKISKGWNNLDQGLKWNETWY